MSNTPLPKINRLLLVGVGLIGGSLALAIRRNQTNALFCHEIIGLDSNTANLKQALSLNVVDRIETDWSIAAQVDLIVIAVPLNAYAEVFNNIKPHLNNATIITDTGSAKACVLQQAEHIFAHVPERLVLAHPIAGTEQSGVDAAFAELYQNRRVIITQHQQNDAHAVSLVKEMWVYAGANVEEMDVKHHDEVLAITSHLPHMLAFGLVDSLARNNDVDEIFRYAAGGFRDFTRIASSNPTMWKDICLHNRSAILQAIQNYKHDLDEIETAIENADADTLKRIFEHAKAARDRFCG